MREVKGQGICLREELHHTDSLLFMFFVGLLQQTPQALHQFDDLTLPLHVKIDFIITFRCMIDRFLQTQQRLDHLARQDIADPHADE